MKRRILLAIALVVTGVIALEFAQPGLMREGFRRLRQYAQPIAPSRLDPSHPDKLKAFSQALGQAGFRLGDALFVRIFKDESEAEVWLAQENQPFRLFKTYPICRWSGTLGPKIMEGDGQSPEGFYRVSRRQLKPDSTYFRAFNVGFPNAYDRAHGRTGSFLMVHGACVSIGCYAMTDDGIAEIYALADAALAGGRQHFDVHIFPFRPTQENLTRRGRGPWAEFWGNLAEGYAAFEKDRAPLDVGVKDSRYVFGAAVRQRGAVEIAGW